MHQNYVMKKIIITMDRLMKAWTKIMMAFVMIKIFALVVMTCLTSIIITFPMIVKAKLV